MKIDWIASSWRNLSKKQQYLLITASATVVIIILLLLLLPVRAAVKIEFAPYNSNQGGFSVHAPDGSLHMSSQRTKFLDNSVMLFTHETITPAGVFTVTHFDLPPGIITPAERSNIVNHLAADFILPLQGIITNTAEFELQGYSGTAIKAKGALDDAEMIAEAVIILVANRVYVTGVYGSKGILKQRHINNFINSFRFNF